MPFIILRGIFFINIYDENFFLFLFILLNNMSIHAQENFEGKIIYKSDATGMEIPDISVEVFIKGHKMFLRRIPKENKLLAQYCLYDFQKAIWYNFHYEDSIVVSGNLEQLVHLKKNADEATNNDTTSINSYMAKKEMYQIMGSINPGYQKIEAWFSKELLFKVPDSIQTIPNILAIFNSNSISLKVLVSMKGHSENLNDSAKILTYASEINKMSLDDSLFEIPSYFKIMDNDTYLQTLLRKFQKIDAELPALSPPAKKTGRKKAH